MLLGVDYIQHAGLWWTVFDCFYSERITVFGVRNSYLVVSFCILAYYYSNFEHGRYFVLSELGARFLAWSRDFPPRLFFLDGFRRLRL